MILEVIAVPKGNICVPKDKLNHWMQLVDEETGLYNRLFLVHFLNEAYARATRHETPLSCLMIQPRWWRGAEEINQYEPGFSSVLRDFGHFLLLNIRTGDILGRWAREEYLLVASYTSPVGARQVAGNLLRKLSEYEFHEMPDLTVSIRAGISGLPENRDRVRYAEDLPVIAQEDLQPIFGSYWVTDEIYIEEELKAASA